MKVLVLAGGADQLALISVLKERKCEVILVDYFENPPAKEKSDKHYVVSTVDIVKVLDIAIKENVDIVTTACTDQALLTVAKVSECLKKPFYLSYEKALHVTNKLYMKQIMIENEIPTSNYQILTLQYTNINPQLKYPLIVKPVDSNSSKGIKKVNTEKELDLAISNAASYTRSNEILVEEYIEGTELSVDVFINDEPIILSITQTNKIKNKDSFTIYQSRYPVSLSDAELQTIKSIIKKICLFFELDKGPLLVQLIKSDIGIYVIEFSPRMGGGSKYRLIEILSGINIMNSYVDFILKDEIPEMSVTPFDGCVLMNYIYCKNGILKNIEGLDYLKDRGVILDYFCYKTKGMKFSKIENSSDRAAGFVVMAKDEQELCNKLEIANNKIRVLDVNGVDIMEHKICTL